MTAVSILTLSPHYPASALPINRSRLWDLYGVTEDLSSKKPIPVYSHGKHRQPEGSPSPKNSLPASPLDPYPLDLLAVRAETHPPTNLTRVWRAGKL